MRESPGLGAGENSTVREKLNSGMRTLSALTDWALEGSVVTGDSMRARGYGTAKRTSFQIYRMKALDWILIAVMLILTGVGRSGGRHGRRGGGVYAEACHSARHRHLRAGLYCLLRLPLYPLCTTHEGGPFNGTYRDRESDLFLPFRGRPSLSDVSLTIRRGEYVVLCGKSGSGKTNASAAPEIGACRPTESEAGTSASTAFPWKT